MIKFKKGCKYLNIVMSTGEKQIFVCTKILQRKSTKERVFVEGYIEGKNNNKIDRYQIGIANKNSEYACETILLDKRYAYRLPASKKIED